MHSSTHSSMKATGNHPPSKNKTTMGETKKPYEETACSPLFNQSLQKIKATETKPESPNPIKLNRKTLSKSFSFCARKKQRHNHRAASSPRPLLAFLTEFRSARGNRGSKRELQCSFKDPENIVHWLSNGCPEDVVPHILAFAGPHTAASFSRVNKHWNKVMKEEETWRIMCEGLYKWKKGDQKPSSWREYYSQHPCVPVDYPSISSALNSVQTLPTQHVLVRPGTYDMPRAIHVIGASVRIEKMQLPDSLVSADIPADPVDALQAFQAAFCRSNLICPDLMDDSSLSDYGDYAAEADEQPMQNVVLISQASKKRNEPLFRVSGGKLTIRNIRLQHESMGIDIWGGNSALHVEPDEDDDTTADNDNSPNHAMVRLEGCEVTSSSGRGIVVLSGGQLHTKNCHVHSCAATGIYVGGETSRARLMTTDVTTNGLGNQRTGGIARGHSGIYLEHGQLDIIDSNVSLNSASGISVVAPGERRLTLSGTDLIGNGVVPIDVPFGVQEDDAVFDLMSNSSKLGNRMLPHGSFRTRSTLLQDGPPVISMAEFEEYH